MKLFFLRHGLADRSQWHGLDSERPLTDEGRTQMEALAGLYQRMEMGIETILTSPYIRARQTAEIAAQAFKLPPEAILQDERLSPGFGVADLKEMLAALPKNEAIMLVGHEPDFSSTIARLIGGGRVACKKAGLARVDILDMEALVGELIWLVTPKLINRIAHGGKL